MNFLRIADYYSFIKQDNLDVIIEDAGGSPDQRFLTETEAAALSEIQSYLRHRYNVAEIFAPVDQWSITKTYNTGDYVYEVLSNNTYRSKIDANLGNLLSDGGSWEITSDPRDAQMKLYLIDITLYHLHSRINPRNIPDLRLTRRDEAVKWLTMISKGDITIDLPEIDDAESKGGYSIIAGGETKRVNNY